MGFRCGIVGLPNVGKSTLFNALTQTAQAEAANYPFSTIEPNLGQVAVPDDRLEIVAKLAGSAVVVPTQLTFVDIAGLVSGAARGEGLGNRFLHHIREVDALVHVLRCFEDAGVTHICDKIDPIADAETVETELMLADLESLERRIVSVQKRVRGGDKDYEAKLALMERCVQQLGAGRPARSIAYAAGEADDFCQLQLLTAKPVLYVANVDEASAAAGNDFARRVAEWAGAKGAASIVVSAAIEAEITQLDDPAERVAFLAELGLAETGLSRIIAAGYRLLGLITFFTAGPKEAHAWTVSTGTGAARAAGRIHSDFERGFIRAETIAYPDFVACGGEAGAKEAGLIRLEGRDYRVRDGDVLHVRFST